MTEALQVRVHILHFLSHPTLRCLWRCTHCVVKWQPGDCSSTFKYKPYHDKPFHKWQTSSFVILWWGFVRAAERTPHLTAGCTVQGICRWVVLRSQLGAPVAAVQLEVSFTHIGGTPVGNSPAAMPPLLRWVPLLPCALRGAYRSPSLSGRNSLSLSSGN